MMSSVTPFKLLTSKLLILRFIHLLTALGTVREERKNDDVSRVVEEHTTDDYSVK